MSVWSGNGGALLINAVTTEVNINKWTLRKNSRLTENTHSGVTSTNYEHVVPDHSGTAELAWDDTTLPDTDLGLTEGTKVTLIFQYGTSGKTASLTSTTIESLEEMDDNANDIIRVSINFKGGSLTRPVT